MKTFELLNIKNSGMEGVPALFNKAHSQLWDVEASIDWRVPITPQDPLVDVAWVAFSKTATFKALPRRVQEHFARRALGHLVRSFILAESVAQHVSLKIALKSRWADHKAYCSSQALDESRHHLTLTRVLEQMGGDQEEVDAGTRALFDKVLAMEDMSDLICWEQFYLESVAVNVLKDVAHHATHPTIKQVFGLIQRDESRHMGFGVAWVKSLLESMTLDERIEFARAWLPQLLTLPFNHQDPVTFSRTVRWLREGGVDNSIQVCSQLMVEQQAVLMSRAQQLELRKHLPQELKSAKRVGLMEPAILEALDLGNHPLVRAAVAGKDTAD